MDDDKLVRMANQMATFFRAYPDDDAARGIRDHIRSFWTPGMRAALSARIGAERTGIEPLVVRAMGLPDVAAGRESESGESPIRQELAGPEALGALASDAG